MSRSDRQRDKQDEPGWLADRRGLVWRLTACWPAAKREATRRQWEACEALMRAMGVSWEEVWQRMDTDDWLVWGRPLVPIEWMTETGVGALTPSAWKWLTVGHLRELEALLARETRHHGWTDPDLPWGLVEPLAWGPRAQIEACLREATEQTAKRA
ncbi:hypothetical protein [Nitrospira sp. Kam-Ns4a]